MISHTNKIVGEGLAYDDVLLVPAYSEILPRDVNISSQFTKNIRLNTPIVSAAMDTVTEAKLAIALARQGGLGFIHKNMSIEEQASQVDLVKRSESGMILNPITLNKKSTLRNAEDILRTQNTNNSTYKSTKHKTFSSFYQLHHLNFSFYD